jgi:hypothetical protein
MTLVINMKTPLKKRTYLVQLNTCKTVLMKRCYLLILSTSGSSNFTFPLKETPSSGLAKTCKIIIHFIQLKWRGTFKCGTDSTDSCAILVVCMPIALDIYFFNIQMYNHNSNSLNYFYSSKVIHLTVCHSIRNE